MIHKQNNKIPNIYIHIILVYYIMWFAKQTTHYGPRLQTITTRKDKYYFWKCCSMILEISPATWMISSGQQNFTQSLIATKTGVMEISICMDAVCEVHLSNFLGYTTAPITHCLLCVMFVCGSVLGIMYIDYGICMYDTNIMVFSPCQMDMPNMHNHRG